MPREEMANQAALARVLPSGAPGPHWRALLESRWQARLREVTELSLAYHVAASAGPGGSADGATQQEVQTLLSRAVGARRKLANVEEALGRLAAGNCGSRGQSGAQIPARLP